MVFSVAAEGEPSEAEVGLCGGSFLACCLVRAAHEAKDVQLRQLDSISGGALREKEERARLAILSEDDALGQLLWRVISRTVACRARLELRESSVHQVVENSSARTILRFWEASGSAQCRCYGSLESSTMSLPDDATKSNTSPISLLLLKTRSQPQDPYAVQFAEPDYAATFVPVLTHTPNAAALNVLTGLLSASSPLSEYGGLIVTSQRTVEVLASAIEPTASRRSLHGETHPAWVQSEKVVYVVGPATGTAVTTALANHFPRWRVHGQDCGNGSALAEYIVQHYDAPAAGIRPEPTDAPTGPPALVKRGAVPDEGRAARAPLLFVAGETRRDTVPATLMARALPAERRVRVDEVACYATEEREEFPAEFAETLRLLRNRQGKEPPPEDPARPPVWVVIFSPTHCGTVLETLGWTRADSSHEEARRMASVRVASIGPTTAEFMKSKWDFDVDVCAERPSPEGIKAGIEAWSRRKKAM